MYLAFGFEISRLFEVKYVPLKKLIYKPALN
jgi:hypothetical protein